MSEIVAITDFRRNLRNFRQYNVNDTNLSYIIIILRKWRKSFMNLRHHYDSIIRKILILYGGSLAEVCGGSPPQTPPSPRAGAHARGTRGDPAGLIASPLA
jgi:hypothetical protein